MESIGYLSDEIKDIKSCLRHLTNNEWYKYEHNYVCSADHDLSTNLLKRIQVLELTIRRLEDKQKSDPVITKLVEQIERLEARIEAFEGVLDEL